ncbi:MAG TPA: hypothetical protein VF484_05210, partial [Candidatus Limnocylindrales bacterium]
MSHPSLGQPPLDLRAGHPEDAAALRRAVDRVAARALETAVEIDMTFRDRYDELQLRELLADLHAFVGQLAKSIAGNEPKVLGGWAEQVAVRYRKRAVGMDDVITLCEGLRRAAPMAVTPAGMPAVDASID